MQKTYIVSVRVQEYTPKTKMRRLVYREHVFDVKSLAEAKRRIAKWTKELTDNF